MNVNRFCPSVLLGVLSCAGPKIGDAGVDGGRVEDAGPAIQDAGRPFDVFDYVPDSGIGSTCKACLLANNCGVAINGCVNSQVCSTGLACTVGRCFLNVPEADGGRLDAGWRQADGGIELVGCALSCFNGNLVVTLQALGASACAIGCAGTCASDFLQPVLGPLDAGRATDGGP